MPNPSIASLVASGTNLYLDSIDPALVKLNLEWGAVGATSNPIIIAGLIETGRFDEPLAKLIDSGKDDPAIAWELTDQLVRDAQAAFLPTWKRTNAIDKVRVCIDSARPSFTFGNRRLTRCSTIRRADGFNTL